MEAYPHVSSSEMLPQHQAIALLVYVHMNLMQDIQRDSCSYTFNYNTATNASYFTINHY